MVNNEDGNGSRRRRDARSGGEDRELKEYQWCSGAHCPREHTDELRTRRECFGGEEEQRGHTVQAHSVMITQD